MLKRLVSLFSLFNPMGITQGKEYAELEWPIDLGRVTTAARMTAFQPQKTNSASETPAIAEFGIRSR